MYNRSGVPLANVTKGDEAKPDCSKCRSRGEECEWDTGITFRLTGLDPQHPSMLQAKTPKVVNQNGLKVGSEPERSYSVY
jgi:hypothetical protein